MEELLSLARENNAMLKRVCAWLDKVDSQEHRDAEDVKQLAINMFANVIGGNNGARNNNDQIFFR